MLFILKLCGEKNQVKSAWLKQLCQCSISFCCSIGVLEKGDERESQRNGCYLWEPKEWLLSVCINRLVSPREVSWSVAEGFRYNLAVKFWFLSCCRQVTGREHLALGMWRTLPLFLCLKRGRRQWIAHSTTASDFITEKVTKLIYAKHLFGIYSTFSASHFALYLSWQ